MTHKTIGALRALLLIGAAAGVLAFSVQATASMHSMGSGGSGMHSGGGTHPMSPPPAMPGPGFGTAGAGTHPMSLPPAMPGPGPSIAGTGTHPMNPPPNMPAPHHHHHHFDDDDDFFFFDPFWWPYPYTVETTYVEVPASDGYWYYCPDSKSYYPYAKECASKWERVSPRPPSE